MADAASLEHRNDGNTQYLTPGEAARSLHVSPKTINRWSNMGLLPCIVTLGGHRRFRLADIGEAARQMSTRGALLGHSEVEGEAVADQAQYELATPSDAA